MRLVFALFILLFAAFAVPLVRADLTATFNSATDVPVTTSSYTASGTFSATLNFAPSAGTTLTVIKNTGLPFINGRFSNLAQWQSVTLSYGGISYPFVANYYGGTGNDLVLQWASTRLVAWGAGFLDQLGDGASTNRLAPVNLALTGALAGKSVVSVSAGFYHSLALCADGTLIGWGGQNYGELADIRVATRVPVALRMTNALIDKTIVQVAAGASFSLCLCSDGTVVGFGTNPDGQLGNGASGFASFLPTFTDTTGVLAGKSVVAVAAGGNHSLALCSDGTLVAWGNNASGQLGNNSTTGSKVPVAVKMDGALAGKTVVSIGCGSGFSVALCSDGTVATWGINSDGQLGGDVAATSSPVPVLVATTGALAGKTVTRMTVGGTHVTALCSDGTVASWGSNSIFQLGTPKPPPSSSVPLLNSNLEVISGKTIVALSACYHTTFAMCADGTIASWGQGIYGELGNNNNLASAPAVLVSNSPAVGEATMAAATGSSANHIVGIIALPPSPIVNVGAATNLALGSITLNGTVNAATGSAPVFFDYGLTADYGSSAAAAPSPVTGNTDTAVSVNLAGLLPGTTYHYRLRATTAGGTASSADFTFTTPPGGTMTLGPASPFDPGAPLTVTFAGWTDANPPLTYSVLVDGVVVSPQSSSSVCNFAAPAAAGGHTLKGRVYNALGNYAELSQSFTVYTPQESWRVANFGTPQNTSNAADTADPDGDGCTNWFEYVAGLAPTDAASRFHVRVDMVAGQPGQKAIVFGPVMPGRTYTVKSKAGLTDATWTALTNFTTSDNGAERTVLELNAENDLRFYEVEITLP